MFTFLGPSLISANIARTRTKLNNPIREENKAFMDPKGRLLFELLGYFLKHFIPFSKVQDVIDIDLKIMFT